MLVVQKNGTNGRFRPVTKQPSLLALQRPTSARFLVSGLTEFAVARKAFLPRILGIAWNTEALFQDLLKNGQLQTLCNDYLFELHVKKPLYLDGKFRSLEEQIDKLQKENSILKNVSLAENAHCCTTLHNAAQEVQVAQLKDIIMELGASTGTTQTWPGCIEVLKQCAKEHGDARLFLESRNAQLVDQLAEYKALVISIEAQLEILKVDNTQLNHTAQLMEQQNLLYREKIELLVGQLSSKTSVEYGEKDVVQDFTSSQNGELSLVEELRAEAKKKKELVESLTSSLEYFTKENEELRGLLSQATAQVNAISFKEEALRVSNAELKADLEARPSMDKLEDASLENDKLQAQVKHLEKGLVEEVGELQKRLAEKEHQLTTMIADSKAHAETEIAQQQKLDKFVAFLASNEETIAKYFTTTRDLEAKCDQLAHQLEEVMREHKEREAAASTEIEVIKGEHQSLRQAVCDFTTKCDLLTRERDHAVHDRDSARQDRDIAREERDAAFTDRDLARGERDTAICERDAAFTERDRAVGELDNAITERNHTISAKDIALKEKGIALRERDVAIRDRDAAMHELDSIVRKCDIMEHTRVELKAGLRASEVLKTEHTELKAAYSSKLASEEQLLSTLATRDAAIHTLKDELAHSNRELANVKLQLEQQCEKVDKLLKTEHSSREVFVAEINTLKKTLSTTTDEAGQARMERDAASKEIQHYKKECEKVRHKVESITEERNSMTEERNDMKNKLGEAQQEVRSKREAEASLQVQCKSLLQQISVLQNEGKGKEDHISLLASTNSALEKKLAENEVRLRILSSEALRKTEDSSPQKEKALRNPSSATECSPVKHITSPQKTNDQSSGTADNKDMHDGDSKRKKQKTSHDFHDNTESAVAREIRPSPEKKYVVSLSGFKDEVQKKALAEVVGRLGGEIRVEAEFDSKITHVVTPLPNTRTMKTLAAALTYRWIMSPEWITASDGAGRFVTEADFGIKPSARPFEGKKFFFSDGFKKEPRQQKIENANNLIDLGKGIIIDNRDGADFILVSDANAKEKHATGQVITFSQFVDLIPLTHSTSNSLPSSNPSVNSTPTDKRQPPRLSVRFADAKAEQFTGTGAGAESDPSKSSSSPGGKRKNTLSVTSKSKKK